VIIALT